MPASAEFAVFPAFGERVALFSTKSLWTVKFNEAHLFLGIKNNIAIRGKGKDVAQYICELDWHFWCKNMTMAKAELAFM